MLNKAYIDMSALKENAQAIKSKLKQGVKFCAVVKADAYGHGAQMVANALYPYADCFAVALVEEAVSLRYCGIDKDILVLIPPFFEDLQTAVHFNLTLAVDSPKQLLYLNSEGQKQNKRVKVHLKFDCGMNRLGANIDELKGLLALASRLKYVKIDGLFSHLAQPENKKATFIAENKFLLANNLVKGYNRKVTCHLSASGGFIRALHYDMVRVGILLYGYKPFETDYIDVKKVMRVYAPPVKQRFLQKGQSALYGNCPAGDDTFITLLRYGYADGLSRCNVQSQFNARCMDITAVKGKTQDDLVLVMGDADKIAKDYGTISYEVLTKCALRAQKIYF